MASVAEPRGGAASFLRAALAQLVDRRWWGIFLLMLVFLGGTNAVLALQKPETGAAPSLAFALAGLIRVVALISLSVAALRIATKSPRRTWMPDGGFFLYLAFTVIGFAAAAIGAFLGSGLPELQRTGLTELMAIILTAPLAVWSTAAAVERPLALSPERGLRGLGRWLPPFLLWAALLLVPLATCHALVSFRMVDGAGSSGFWPLAAFDALVSSLFVLLTLALHLAAYRSVARG
jgi:hypothetical protein